MIKKLTGYLFFLLLPTLLFSQNIQTVGEPADTLKQAHIRVDTTLHVYGNTILDGNLTMNTIATEQVKLGTGSDAAPELSSVGDPNTGIRFPGGDKMQFVQNGLNSHTFRPYRYTIRYSDGDTLGLSLNGSSVIYDSNVSHYFQIGGSNYFLVTSIGSQFKTAIFPTSTDLYNVGATDRLVKNYYGSDYIGLGGKGQGASLEIFTYDPAVSQTAPDSVFNVKVLNGNPTVYSYDSSGGSSLPIVNANGQSTNIKQATMLLTIGPVAAATDTCLNLIPAGSMVVGVTTRVTTAVTGSSGFTGFSIGDGTDADRWGANVAPGLNETTDLTDCTITSIPIYSSATSIILTQVGGATFNTGGVVRVTVHYISLTAPTG